MNSLRDSEKRRRGFTRPELLACCAVVLLLMVVLAAPVWATTKSDTGRASCFNNLRLIGRAVQSWTSDHEQQFPWRVMASEGGTRQPNTRPGNVFIDYSVFSNEMVTPRILACPSDTGVRVARTFSTDFDGGLLSIQYRNQAISYSLNMDGSPNAPRSWLTGDRNMRVDFGDNSWPCSAGVVPTSAISVNPAQGSVLAWSNNVHGLIGHILTTDGSVEWAVTPKLREIILQSPKDEFEQIHFLKARN